MISNSESQIIYKQTSEVLEQWTGRHTQNYYELKHIFQLLNAFTKDQYQGDGLILSLKELGRSWQPVKRLGTLFISLLCLVISVTLVSVLICQKFHFAPQDRFGEVADWACEDQLSGKEHPICHTTNDFYQVLNLPSLNSAISLDKAKIFESLSLSKSLKEVSLCTRPCSAQGKSTSQQLTQSDDSERFQFDDELDTLMPDLDS